MGDRQRSEAASTIFAVQDYAGTWSAERGSCHRIVHTDDVHALGDLAVPNASQGATTTTAAPTLVTAGTSPGGTRQPQHRDRVPCARALGKLCYSGGSFVTAIRGVNGEIAEGGVC